MKKSNAMPTVGRTLFPRQAKSRFVTITGDRYRSMQVRAAQWKLPLPFSLEQLRDHLYQLMGEAYDGGFKCCYCGRVCDIGEIELDHKTPIARGGSLGLDNIGAPCAPCNQAKGEATAKEFEEFMNFLEIKIPLARTDIFHRLSTWGKLVSGKRRAEMLARNGGQMPPKKAKAGKPPLVELADKYF